MGALVVVPLGLQHDQEQEERVEQKARLAKVLRRRRERKAVPRRPYTPRVYKEPRSYLQLSEEQCIQRLRFSKAVVTEICQLLQAELQPRTRAWTALPVEVKVTVTLNFLASGSFQAAAAADLCHISQFAAHCCIRDVTDALYSRREDFISFPEGAEQQAERADGFAHIANFPKVQGVIDCTHVALRTPHVKPELYRNHKGFHSLNVQLLCDHEQKFLMVNAMYPGSSHDAFILRQSEVPAMFQPPDCLDGWLLGDKDYPLLPWLLTPVQSPASTAQCNYNQSHRATRSLVKDAIRVLKARFRCLDRSGGALQYSPERVSRFVVVCCMLHNLAIMRGQPLPEDFQQMDGEDDDDDDDDEDEEEVEEEEVADEEEEEGEEGKVKEENASDHQQRRALSGRTIRAHLIAQRFS
ncbi:putative nuclease HARBI1 [Mobula hypostoma]|uniref:putative nuclease HARBI1 n=1 Tax=Mobula hypostoma TaxID=723540 RepID=UPI002FC2AEE5